MGRPWKLPSGTGPRIQQRRALTNLEEAAEEAVRNALLAVGSLPIAAQFREDSFLAI